MGKFARAIAYVHEYSTDYLVDGTKFVGRKVKSGAVKVKDATVHGVQTVKAEHADIEDRRAARKEAVAAQEAAAEEILEAALAQQRSKNSAKKAKQANKAKATATKHTATT